MTPNKIRRHYTPRDTCKILKQFLLSAGTLLWLPFSTEANKGISGWGQQHPTPTTRNVGEALLSLPELSDGLPESSWSWPKVVFHGLMASSHTRVFTSETSKAAARLACRYLPAIVVVSGFAVFSSAGVCDAGSKKDCSKAKLLNA